MLEKSHILLEKLVVVGVRKNYTVSFNPGVNIIYGDSTTGKSSILNLIDYLLGGKSFKQYPEIEEAANYVVLQLFLGGTQYTIKRDIFDSQKMVEVYPCTFEEIDNHAPRKYIPTFRKDALSDEYGYYSDFLFDALGYEKVKIKVSPSKADSKLNRLSFRNLFKYCYVDQDDLGSKHFLNRGDYVAEARHTEVFRYIFNALDNQISEINAEISEKINEKSSLEKKYKTVSQFLRDTDFSSQQKISETLNNIDANIAQVENVIWETKEKHTSNNELYKKIKSTLNDLNQEIDKKEFERSECLRKIEYFTRLKNEYLLDIKKVEAAQEAKTKIGVTSEHMSLCPICDNTLPVSHAAEKFDLSNEDRLSHEFLSLKRKSKDLEKMISHNKEQWQNCVSDLKVLLSQRDEVNEDLEQNTKNIISPYLAEVETMISKLASLKQEKKSLVSSVRVRNQQENIYLEIDKLGDTIERLKQKLELLKHNSPSITDIIQDMGGYLNEFLQQVNITNRHNVGIGENRYFPYIRGIEYQNITSGGLRTITSIGYLCSFMRAALEMNMQYPSFLMIDTVGKYLGKTKLTDIELAETSDIDDKKEGVSDPEKYQNIYEYMIDLSGKYEEKGKVCQFILVDNDVPDTIVKKYAGFIVAHFSAEGHNNLPIGLIDDAESVRKIGR